MEKYSKWHSGFERGAMQVPHMQYQIQVNLRISDMILEIEDMIIILIIGFINVLKNNQIKRLGSFTNTEHKTGWKQESGWSDRR